MRNVLFVFSIFLVSSLSLFASDVNASEIKTLRFYPHVSDSSVRTSPYPSSWATQYTNSIGMDSLVEPDRLVAYSAAYITDSGYLGIHRAFMSFDTSEIPDSANIIEASLNLYPDYVLDSRYDEYSYMSVLRSYQSSPTNIDFYDIDNCGESLQNPTKGSSNIDVADFTVGEYKSIDLNEEGISWISNTGYTQLCVREGHDIENVEIVNNNGITWDSSGISFHSVEADNIDLRPYLEVTFEYTDNEEKNYPLYTQIESTYPSLAETSSWEEDAFAYGSQEWCGDTIGGCGCAITSGVMAGRNAGITNDVLGNDVNPKNINNYLKTVGGYTSDGSVYWLAMQSYFGEFIDGRLASRFKYVGKFDGASAMSAVDEYLTNTGEYATLAYKKQYGHFVWLPEKTETEYLVRDPKWYMTETANDSSGENIKDYNNSFDSVRVYEVLDEPELYSGYMVESYIKGTAQMLYKSLTGYRVGYVDGAIVVDLENSSYGDTEIISFNGTPSNSTDRKHLIVYEAGNEFTIDVVGTGSGNYKMEVFTINEYGEVATFELEGQTLPGLTTTFTFNLETGEVTEELITLEDFLNIVDLELEGYSGQQQKFFKMWAEKIYDRMENKTVSQAIQSIETYKKLLIARKVDSVSLMNTLDLLESTVR